INDAGSWSIYPIKEATPGLSWSFGRGPALGGGEPYVAGAASPGYAINSASDAAHQVAAKVFLSWLASPEGVETFQAQAGDVTVTSDFEPPVDPVFTTMGESIRNGELHLPMISWQRPEDVLNVEAVAQIQRMIQGQSTPQEVAQALDAKLAAS